MPERRDAVGYDDCPRQTNPARRCGHLPAGSTLGFGRTHVRYGLDPRRISGEAPDLGWALLEGSRNRLETALSLRSPDFLADLSVCVGALLGGSASCRGWPLF